MPPPTDLADKYRSQAIQTAPGPQLLVMLYDRLAADVDIAGFSLDAQDFLATNERLQHAQRIVRMLKHSLNPDGFAGGRDLLALYDFLLSHLVEANLRKDPELVRECGRIIAPLREAWQQSRDQPRTSRWPPTSGLTIWRRRVTTSAGRALPSRRANRGRPDHPVPPAPHRTSCWAVCSSLRPATTSWLSRWRPTSPSCSDTGGRMCRTHPRHRISLISACDSDGEHPATLGRAGS